MKQVIYIMALLLVISQANALGIASDWLEGNTLYLEKGEEYTYGIRIQNMDSDTVFVILEKTGNIGEVVDFKESYELKPKTSKNAIDFKIVMPENAKCSDTFSMGWSITETNPEEGQVSTAKRIHGGISIHTKCLKTKINQKLWTQIGLSIILIGGSVWYGIKKKKQED